MRGHGGTNRPRTAQPTGPQKCNVQKRELASHFANRGYGKGGRKRGAEDGAETAEGGKGRRKRKTRIDETEEKVRNADRESGEENEERGGKKGSKEKVDSYRGCIQPSKVRKPDTVGPDIRIA